MEMKWNGKRKRKRHGKKGTRGDNNSGKKEVIEN